MIGHYPDTRLKGEPHNAPGIGHPCNVNFRSESDIHGNSFPGLSNFGLPQPETELVSAPSHQHCTGNRLRFHKMEGLPTPAFGTEHVGDMVGGEELIVRARPDLVRMEKSSSPLHAGADKAERNLASH